MPSLVEFVKWFRRKGYLNVDNLILLLHCCLPLKCVVLILNKKPKTFLAKFGLNCSCGSSEKDENVKILKKDRQTQG